jgi:MtaA/CmuA family methyltransferase
MTPLQRTLDFIANKPVDVPPLHPIVMQFAAGHAGIKYRDFCLNPESKVQGMIKCADDFSLDWVTVMSDPYAEAEGFGMQVQYPEDSLPVNSGLVINDISDIDRLTVPAMAESARMLGRVAEIELFSRRVGDKYFIVGWVEGPMAEYADLRGLAPACLDLFDHEKELTTALDIMTENAIAFIDAQIDAGAHCIGIGDAACSQIGPAFYKQYIVEREKRLVDQIHSRNALAKLHICGDTRSILPDMIATGADIVDIDHLVGDMSPYVDLLGDTQVLSGNSDPVEVVMRGTADTIARSVRACYEQTKGRGIVSAGCEIPKQTSEANFAAYCAAARSGL